MKTQEGYEIDDFRPTEVCTTIYTGEDFDKSKIESGFHGVVRDTGADDRFACLIYCVWNAVGELVYMEDQWGVKGNYKLNII